MKKIILYLFILVAITCGCNKYDQSLKKIYDFNKLKTYTVNGVDSLNLINDSLGLNFSFYYFDDVDAFFVLSIKRNTGGYDLQCRWSLLNDNKKFSIYEAYGPIGTGPFGNGRKSEWDILKLSRKEFNLKTIYNNKEYYIELIDD